MPNHMTRAAAILSIFLVACAAEAPDPEPEPDRYDECLQLCSETDTDLSSLPANMCPGWDPSEDTAYMRCTGECVARMPRGYWCPPF